MSTLKNLFRNQFNRGIAIFCLFIDQVLDPFLQHRMSEVIYNEHTGRKSLESKVERKRRWKPTCGERTDIVGLL